MNNLQEQLQKLKNQQTETQLMAIAQTIASFDPQSISNLYGFAKSSIIGSVEIVDCVVNHSSIWAEKTALPEQLDNKCIWN